MSSDKQQQHHVGVHPPPQGPPPEGHAKDVYPPQGYPPTGCPQQGDAPGYGLQPPEQKKISGPAFLEGRVLHGAGYEPAPVQIQLPIPAGNGDVPAGMLAALRQATPDYSLKIPEIGLTIAAPLLMGIIVNNPAVHPVAQTTATFLAYMANLLALIGVASQVLKQNYGRPLGAAAILMVVAAITVLMVSAFTLA